MAVTAQIQQFLHVAMQRSMGETALFLKEHNLSMTQLAVLARLNFEGPATVTEIGRTMGISNAAVSQLLDRLVRAHYVDQHQHQSDRRVRLHQITESGRRLVDDVHETRTSWVTALVAGLTDQQCDEIAACFATLNTLLRDMYPPKGPAPCTN